MTRIAPALKALVLVFAFAAAAVSIASVRTDGNLEAAPGAIESLLLADASAQDRPAERQTGPGTADRESRSAAPEPIGDEAAVSVGGLVAEAGPVVKGVMLLLVLMSIGTWTIFLVKLGQMGRARGRLEKLRDSVRDTDDRNGLRRLADGADTGVGAMLKAGIRELEAANTSHPDDRSIDRARTMMRTERAIRAEELQGGMGFLATTGATAPFIGLFGTVWGIMNSFIGIAETQTTNLAVVAPGIAEALIATALGLFAAIPAVVLYNYFARRVAKMTRRMDDLNAAYLSAYERCMTVERAA